ncbi:ABC-2 type transport system permease protein [Actinomadura hallensis]|uniref:Transport permease protein n=1 Tax=Actinomadura hallensis TaxID=337895 RepID=A0A543IF47_9ACTN|nr:ABC transporter permease [Actinomadura hallensis]TQM69201.1 ABC-2 type transport system permease protein [Actinomadura hallensis]HLV71596.1 ABC transporter permease [Vulgatibacteraceae bacterium]
MSAPSEPGAGTGAAAGVVRVRVPEPGLRQDVRAVKIVLHRELLRFWRDKLRMVSGLVQPVLWLLVMGTGLSNLMATGGAGSGVDLRTFIFPGVCAMSVMFTAMFSAGSIVWDREFGFLREMLVAPVSRSAIVIGKCIGGALVATLQGAVIVALAGLAGVPYDPLLLAELVAMMFLGAFALTGFGVMMAARITQMQSFFAVMQMAMLPMMFLSGALYPLHGLPAWLSVLTKLNPLTYAVDPMRQAVFARLDLSPALQKTFSSGVTWNGWLVPVWLELLIVAGMGVVLMAVAILQFRRAE